MPTEVELANVTKAIQIEQLRDEPLTDHFPGS